MFSGSNIVIHGGTFNYQTRTSRGMDILMEWIATDAFHNSRELYDAPKCHPRTRVAVLDNIMRWVSESEWAREDFILWLFGPAGAGKSAIAKRIAEIAAEMDMLIATFFFSRTSPTRRTEERLIATLAYQLTLSIPNTRSHVEDAIERDPAIFKKNVQTQIDTLLIKPFRSISPPQIFPLQKLIIIDGLDECNDRQAQLAILEAISHSFTQHRLPIIFLVASRPEPDLDTSFNCNEPLRSIHRRLALDATYRPSDDIRLFFSEKFEYIKRTHRLRSTIPITWPTQEILDKLVETSSGQFIYASTVVKFVESSYHRPTARLNIILGISPAGNMNPFAELDALYNHILSSVDDIQITLLVLSLYVMTPHFVSGLDVSMSPELFLSLEPGDIQLALMNLSSIITYHESSGVIEILHASFVDFLSDKHRSTAFYIDIASTCTDFVRRILQYVRGPDGIQAGDNYLLGKLNVLFPWIPEGQLQSDILNFDFDAFINASIRRKYKERSFLASETTLGTFDVCKAFLDHARLEDGDKAEALDRLNQSLESRLRIYQSDRRLGLLLPLAASSWSHWQHEVPYCICVDVLLGLDDHDLHLVDQNALDLRHCVEAIFGSRWIEKITHYIDRDAYISAALHCIHFLSSPPKYPERNECPEMELIYTEIWEATCALTLDIFCKLLEQADNSPELVQSISNLDIHPAVQKYFSAEEVNTHILAFLIRANVRSPDQRMISAIQRPFISTYEQPSMYARSSDKEERKATWRLVLQHVDRCCLNVH